jgi:hypothetical protein
MAESKDVLIKRLSKLLETFSIPQEKKTNYIWLKNNLHIGNSGNRNMNEVKNILISLLNLENDNRKNNHL